MRRVIGIGETVLDIIFREDQPQKAVPGGSTFNAMITLGRVFSHTEKAPQIAMITETGDDHIGEIITSFMRDNHVSTDMVTINQGTQSHLSLAFLDDQSNAQYEFYKDHANACLNRSVVPSFTADDIVLFGSFFSINPVLRDYTRGLLQAAHDAGATLYYDINFRKSHIKDIPDTLCNIEENMRLATIVRGSAEDFGYLYGTTNPLIVFTEHIRPFCPHFICTDGASATHVFVSTDDGYHMTQFPVPHIETVVSTIGAGDNFNAGFIYGLVKEGLKRKDLESGALADIIVADSRLEHIISQAQCFSAHVCQRIENYVDVNFSV